MLSPKEKQLISILLQQNKITQQQVSEFLTAAQQTKAPGHFTSLVVAKGLITSIELASFMKMTGGQTSTANASESPFSFMGIGKNFGRYKVRKEIGRGGMGAVYQVDDDQLNRKVALKVVLAGEHVNEKQIQRFLQEARSMAQLKHPNIIEVYEIGTTPRNYFTMEYIDGETLATWGKKDNLSIKKIIDVFAKSSKALFEVHKHGIIHRDIKPTNIMVTKDSEPKLMDFGLAKIADSQLSQSGELLGTPAYMAPEQAEGGKIEKQSDIYALGATLYEVLTGRPPFHGTTFANLVHQIINNDPVSPTLLNPDVPIDVEAICLKCLEKQPEKRYQNAKILAQDFENFLNNQPIIAKPVTKFTLFKKWLLRNKLIVAISMVSLLAILLSFILVIISLRKQAHIQEQAAMQSKEAEHKAKLAQQQAIKERDKAVLANNKLSVAQKKIVIERDKAKAAEQKALRSLYFSNILLAERYCKESQTKNADRILNSAELCPPQIRGWEWLWLKSIAHTEIFTFKHRAIINQCIFTPDNTSIISISNDRRLKIWNSKNGKLRESRSFKEPIMSCSIDRNGKNIAILTKSGLLKICDYKSGRTLRSLVHRNQDGGEHCIFHPNNKYVLCSYQTKEGIADKDIHSVESVVLWDIQTGKKKWTIAAHASQFYNDVLYCDFSPNGKLIVTCSENKTLQIWSTKSGKLYKTLRGHTDEVRCCRFSPDGKTIASSSDGIVILWDVKSGKKMRTFKLNHSRAIHTCFFINDGKWLVSGDSDSKFVLWNIATGDKIKSFMGNQTSILCGVASPNQKMVVSGNYNGIGKVWRLSQDFPITLPKAYFPVRYCAVNNDGSIAVSIPNKSFAFKLWDVKSGKVIRQILSRYPWRSCDFSPDNKKFIAGNSEGEIFLYEASTGKVLCKFTQMFGNAIECKFSEDGTKIVAGGKNKNIYLWSTDSITTKKKIAPMAVFYGHQEAITSCAFSPDGKKIVSAAQDKTCKIWSIGQKEPLVTIQGSFIHARFHPNGKFIVTGGRNKKLIIYEVASGKPVASFKGHTGTISSCIFTRDGLRIISGSFDKTIRIWDANINYSTSKVQKINNSILTLTGHNNFIYRLELSRDNSTLISCGKDKLTKIWAIKKEYLLNQE